MIRFVPLVKKSSRVLFFFVVVMMMYVKSVISFSTAAALLAFLAGVNLPTSLSVEAVQVNTRRRTATTSDPDEGLRSRASG